MAGVNAARPKRHQTYDAVWTKASKRQLRQKPWCECRDAECKCRGTHAGAQVPATDADHIVPRDAFVDPVAAHHFTNLQSLCRSCHSSKTARLDGGFGRMEAP